MKHITTFRILLLSLFFAGVFTATAQRARGGQGTGDREAQRKEMTLRQAQALCERMSLDDATANWFVPLYVEYVDSLAAIRKSSFPEKDKKIDELSDLDAEQLIENQFNPHCRQ